MIFHSIGHLHLFAVAVSLSMELFSVIYRGFTWTSEWLTISVWSPPPSPLCFDGIPYILGIAVF